jgi:hypothetical protein
MARAFIPNNRSSRFALRIQRIKVIRHRKRSNDAKPATSPLPQLRRKHGQNHLAIAARPEAACYSPVMLWRIMRKRAKRHGPFALVARSEQAVQCPGGLLKTIASSDQPARNHGIS